MHTPARPDVAPTELRAMRFVAAPTRATVVLRPAPRRPDPRRHDPRPAAPAPFPVPPPRAPYGAPAPRAPYFAPAPPVPDRPGGPRPVRGYPPPPARAEGFSATACTVALRLLRPRDAQAEPVFVDGSGRRRVLLRALGAVVAAASLTYLVLVGGGALAGPPHAAPGITAPLPGVTSTVTDHPAEAQR